jgi:hypothetical protein
MTAAAVPATTSLPEAATHIGCTEVWLTRQLIARRLPGYKAARKWRMTAADIDQAINICREPAAPNLPVPTVIRPRRRRAAL